MKSHHVLTTLAMLLAFATAASAQSNSNRVAVVNGQVITQDELNKKAEGDLKNLDTRRLQNEASLAHDKQEILQKALEEIVAEKLIEAEAAKEKKTKEQLLEAEVESNVETPSPEEVEAFYTTNFRQFPLTSIHPHAQKSAEAALCANDQHKFWEFHDSMFANQKELSIADLKQRAADLKLDTQAFNQCLDSGRQTAAIQTDIQEGARNGVTGTPALFINGRLLSGNQPYSEIKEMIDDELQRKQTAK